MILWASLMLIAGGLFAGAAIYIDLAQQPARKQIGCSILPLTRTPTRTE